MSSGNLKSGRKSGRCRAESPIAQSAGLQPASALRFIEKPRGLKGRPQILFLEISRNFSKYGDIVLTDGLSGIESWKTARIAGGPSGRGLFSLPHRGEPLCFARAAFQAEDFSHANR
jgi:hypothetical protein